MNGSNIAKAKLQNPNSKLPAPSSQLQIADILAIFHKWGIHTLGQLAALDKEELRARLGNEAVTLWLRATGQATRPLKFVHPPETFEENFEFDHEIETVEPLLFILRRFLEQITIRLNSIYLVARELTLRINFSSRASYERIFKIPQPTNDVDLLFRMLQTHLENPAAAGSEHPIVAVALTAIPVRSMSQQFGLFETALRNPHQLFETLARLTALVGNERVGTPALEETHRSDAFRMETFMWQVEAIDLNRPNKIAGDTPTTAANKCDGHPPSQSYGATSRPPLQKKPALRRFRPSAATSIFVSDRRYLHGNKVRGEIIDQNGPYLLSGNWWDQKTWACAEWDMQLESGEVLRTHESEGIWKIDGIYD